MSNTVIDKSIHFHRKSFSFHLALIMIPIIASFLCFYMTNDEFAKVAGYSLIVVALWASFPLYLSYMNYSYLEKNKKSLESMNLQVPDSCILIKN